jgi:hypothetical protein
LKGDDTGDQTEETSADTDSENTNTEETDSEETVSEETVSEETDTVDTESDETDPTDTTEFVEPEAVCGASGHCVRIAFIESEPDQPYVAAYETNFEPLIGSDPENNFHVHFFWNTIPPEEAGVPGRGPWEVWDLPLGGGEYVFDKFTDANAEEYGGVGATALCVAVARSDHSIETDTVMCLDLGFAAG